ncbi:MAG TPA: hypothetical protein VNO81_00725 [Candidatus Nitrosotenuis sp.]|nr:hypothetical protein [Candidatus Nitrosotenuis sp.]
MARLTLAERRGMYALLQEYFLGVTWERFQADLEEKEWVVLLRCGPQIVGFSTLMRLRLGDLWAFFSGDTIVDRRHRAESELPRAWARHVFHLLDRLGPGKEVWWFLLCAGYKTYRFLPVFFREFYPCPQGDWPEPLRLLRDRLGRARYPQEYDAQAGIVRFGHPTPLRPGVAELTPGRLRDPHVACFVQANPGHARGDELCCLARLSRDNLTPLGRRMLR